jgi:hypothetical protein
LDASIVVDGLVGVDLLVVDLCRHRDYPDHQAGVAVGGERPAVVGIVSAR